MRITALVFALILCVPLFAQADLDWYTDLDEAMAAAEREGKHVLSLHLLGRLDEELSCANSRFFRTMVYTDPSVAKLMRERFILHWHSIRPVPVITIDLGDGRTIKQTITGNSAHYLIDANGSVLDILPGLYSPSAFRAYLETWSGLTEADLPRYHRDRLRETGAEWRRLGLDKIVAAAPPHPASAEEAARLASTKFVLEEPLLTALSLGATLRVVRPREWAAIGEREKDKVEFSEESLAVMRTKQELTPRLLDELRHTVAVDTTFNELELHRRIHGWFVRGQVRDLMSVEERVYDELFGAPRSDPWMGLNPRSLFAALGDSSS